MLVEDFMNDASYKHLAYYGGYFMLANDFEIKLCLLEDRLNDKEIKEIGVGDIDPLTISLG